MWSPVFTLSLVAFVAYLFVQWYWRKYFKFTAQLGGPRAYPVVGSFFQLVGKNLQECFQLLIDVSSTYTTPFKIWVGPVLVLFVSEPKDVELILNSPNCLEKGFVYKFFECDKGLVSAPAKTWKVHRKLLNSSFNLKILKSFVTIFNEKSQMLCNLIDAQMAESSEPFDFHEMVRTPIVSMICATTMGTRVDLRSTRNKEAQQAAAALDKFTEKITLRMFKFWHHFDFIYKMSSDYKQSKSSKDRAAKLSRKVMELKKLSLTTTDQAAEIGEDEAAEYRKPQIFVKKLFQLSKEYPEEFDDIGIRDEIDTMLTAGSETSMLTISHAILFMAIHQEYQEKVVEELRSVFYDATELPDYDVISKLVYTNHVIKETMRIFPPVPFVARTVMEDTKIFTKDLVVPAGVLTVIPIYQINRDPKYWGPNPNAFNPDNFSEEKVAKRHPCSYLPFSHGSRNCIGYNYALISLTIMLASLLRRYKFTTTYTMDTIVKRFHFTLKLKHGHMVSVEKRNF